MPKLPDYTAFGETPSPRISTSVPNYAAPQDVSEGISKGLDRFKEIYKEIEAQREKENLLRAEDAYNQLQLAENELAKGENGYLTKMGKDAATEDIVGDYGKKFRQKQIEIAQTLGNDRQKELFSARGEIAFIRHQDSTMTHKVNQSKVYATSVYNGTVEITKNNAVTNYKNPNIIESEIVRLSSAVNVEGKDKGWSDEQIKKEIEVKTSNIHRAVIDRYLANEETGGANSYFKANKALIKDDKDLIHIESKLREGNSLANAQQAAYKIIDNNTDLETALRQTRYLPAKDQEKARSIVTNEMQLKIHRLAYEEADKIAEQTKGNPTLANQLIKDIKSPQLRGEATKILNAKQEEEKKTEVLYKQEAFSEAMKIIEVTKDPNKIPLKLRSELSGNDIKYLIDRAQGKPIPEEQRKRALDMFKISVADPMKLATMSPVEYQKTKDGLDPEYRVEIERRKEKANKAYKENKKEEAALIPGHGDIDKKALLYARQYGIVKGKELDEANLIKLGAFQIEVQKRIDDKIKKLERPGGKLYESDIQESINEAAKPYLKVSTGLFGGKQLIDVSAEDAAKITIAYDAIPPAVVNEMKAKAKELSGGKIPNEGKMKERIQAAYQYYLRNQYLLFKGKIKASELNAKVIDILTEGVKEEVKTLKYNPSVEESTGFPK